MREIIRTEIDKEWAHFAIVEAGDYVYISYCMVLCQELVQTKMRDFSS